MRSFAVQFLICFFALFPSIANAVEIAEVVEGMRKNIEELKRVDGGFEQSYTVKFSQPEGGRHAVGEVKSAKWAIRYPQMYSMVVFKNFDLEDDEEHIVVHDLSTSTSQKAITILDDDPTLNLYFTPYTSVELKNFCFPIRTTFWEEADQPFYEGRRIRPPPLPRAFSDQEYSISRETRDGIDCVVLDRVGFDKVWVAPDLGFSVIRRELTKKTGVPATYEFKKHQQIGNGWLAHEMIRTQKVEDGDYTTSVVLDKAEIGASDKLFVIDIPLRTFIYDQYRNKEYQVGGQSIEAIQDRVSKSKRVLATSVFGGMGWWDLLFFGVGACGWCFFLYPRFRKEVSNVSS